MKNNKKIILRAYINNNLGDDLFLKILFERYSNTNFFLLDVNKEDCKAFGMYNNVYYISMRDFIKKHREFDGYVDIGGSIFIQQGKGLGGFKKRLLTSLLLKYQRKKTFILGANFGPYNKKYFQWVYKLYFKYLVEDVCFRDKKSYSLFNTVKGVRYAPDIVFQLAEKSTSNKKIKNSLGISIMDIARISELERYKEDYLNKMISLINYALGEGWQVHLISFCNNQGDNEVIYDLVSHPDIKSKEKVKILEYDNNIDKFLEKYGELENIVSLRFHSLILSLIYNQSIFPLTYSNKTINVIEDLDYPVKFSRIQDIKNKSIKSLVEEMKENKVNVNKLVEDSKEQFQMFDLFIKDNYEHKR
ncbi:polysaccharide pyruvyl transferase family protein [Priestia megaterium]